MISKSLRHYSVVIATTTTILSHSLGSFSYFLCTFQLITTTTITTSSRIASLRGWGLGFGVWVVVLARPFVFHFNVASSSSTSTLMFSSLSSTSASSTSLSSTALGIALVCFKAALAECLLKIVWGFLVIEGEKNDDSRKFLVDKVLSCKRTEGDIYLPNITHNLHY
ncbi:hypothetical protein FF38_01656 [Lucilia cuprina]|uniref:Transmembrane protein n=1 Tax=Lucilia cuprina TaxID=7375 RepID=A0A0L0BRJ5_LUCCU|nr:hypothetical protein FF38_01656 [Lucilia cuprina]